MRQNKYHNTKVKTSEGTFDSKREYKRWLELRSMQDKGVISNLNRQVPFELIPHQKINGKVIERAVNYYADFVYYYEGEIVVEDSKGRKTPEYVIKRKLMLYVHGIKIKEV